MDDAIIAIEMMVVKMEEGYDRVAAAAYAWSHTAAPMLAGHAGHRRSASCPTASPAPPPANTPAICSGSSAFALIASWVVAVVFTPYLGVKLLPEHRKTSKAATRRSTTRRATTASAGFWAGRFAANGSWPAAVVGLFVVAVLGMGVVKKQFFPISDRPEVLVEVQMPYGTSHRADQRRHREGRSLAGQAAGSEDRHAYIGQGAPRFYLAMAPELPDPSFAKIVVLTPRAKARDSLKIRLREASPTAWRRKRGCA